MSPDTPRRIGLIRVEAGPSVPVAAAPPALLMDWLTAQLEPGWKPLVVTLHRPLRAEVEASLRRLVDEENCRLVFTLGGIGPTTDEIVPDAVRAVCPKQFPGFGERIRHDACPVDETALLMRPTAGIRRQSVVVSLPAEPALLGAVLPALFPAIPNAVLLASGERIGRRMGKGT